MTKVNHKMMFLRAALGAGLVTLMVGGAVAAANIGTRATSSTAHGANIQFKTQTDTNFCIDVAPGSTQGRKLSLSTCSPSATERWAVTRNSDGSNLFIDSQGLCVDAAGRKVGDGVALRVANCSFVKSQRFSFNSIGQFRISGTTMCLSIPRAVSAVAVFLETCNGSSARQQFKLAF